MRPDLAHAALTAVRRPHTFGHTCDDGRWYNPNVGTRTPCPVSVHLTLAAEQVDRLHASVHDAAHNDAAMTAVAEGMTGLTLADLDPEDAAGWLQAARMATEALAAYLDRDPALERRAAAVRDRLAAAGLTPGE